VLFGTKSSNCITTCITFPRFVTLWFFYCCGLNKQWKDIVILTFKPLRQPW
jgi:hypothetical protein